MYNSLNELEADVAAKIAKNKLEESLGLIKSFVETIVTAGYGTGGVYGSPLLDQFCQQIGAETLKRIRKSGSRSNRPTRGVNVYIATELYSTGGHSAVLEDFIASQPDRKHYILLTDILRSRTFRMDGIAVYERFSALRRYVKLGAEIETPGQKDSLLNRLKWLQRRMDELRPERTFLFNHHQDTVAVAAVQPELSGELHFCHHGDHELSLGVFLRYGVHIDFHSMGFASCRNDLGFANNVYLPLTVPDLGARPETLKFFMDGFLRTCSSGSANKFESSYLYSYADLVPEILAATGGKHFHIGTLSQATTASIHAKLKHLGIDPRRFVQIPWVESVWNEIIRHRIDIYISSFPIGGARVAVEVMGAGIPMAVHRNYRSRSLSEADFVYADAFIWEKPEELLDFLSKVDIRLLEMQHRLARAHYESHHSPALLHRELSKPTPQLKGYSPPPLRAHRKDTLQIAMEHMAEVAGLKEQVVELEAVRANLQSLQEYVQRVHRSLAWRILRKARSAVRRAGCLARLPFKFAFSIGAKSSDELAQPTGSLQTTELEPRPAEDAFLPLFQPAFYLEKYPHVANSGMSPVEHYLTEGYRRGFDPNPWFSTRYYLENYGEVKDSGVDPLRHYLQFGAREGRQPHPQFDSNFYLYAYEDVAKANFNPLQHFLEYGIAEGRDPHPYQTVEGDPVLGVRLAGLLGIKWGDLMLVEDLAMEFAQAGKLKEAANCCRESVKAAPYYTDAKLLLVKLCLHMGRHGDAIATYKSVHSRAVPSLVETAQISRKQAVLTVENVRAWCESRGSRVSVLDTERWTRIQSPRVFGIAPGSLASGDAPLPEVYLAEIKNATAIGATDLIITQDQAALYDELAFTEEGRFGIKTQVVKFVEQGKVLVDYRQDEGDGEIDRAIHFCKDYSGNYFHWLIECLPRLWVIDQFPEFDNTPLLVDAGLYDQQMDALDKLNYKNRPLHFIKSNSSVRVRHLIYPSNLSTMHDNYDFPVSFDKDMVVSPHAVRFIREMLIPPARKRKDQNHGKRIYVSRRNSGYRKLINDEEVEHAMRDLEFTLVEPESLSLKRQIEVFSKAEVIVGPTGAGIANIIFAPDGCKTVVLSSDNRRINPYYFSHIAHLARQELYFSRGPEIRGSADIELHNDFYIPVPQLLRNLKSIL